MKIAVISDVHGFSLAMDRVLANIQQEPGIDAIVVAGDIAEVGPDPAGAVDRIRDAGYVTIQGNTDLAIGTGSRTGKASRWTREQLGEERASWLRDLPFSHRISPPGATEANQDLLIVHASPWDVHKGFAPGATEAEVLALIGDAEASVIAFGHVHVAYIRELPNTTLIDVAAVGNPKDGDLRSKWGLITWDDRWRCELRYVDYPVDETVAQFRQSGHPSAEQEIAKLLKASYAE